MARVQQVIARLKQQSIVILGAGLSGQSCLEFLHAHQISCAINDSRKNAVDTESFKASYPDVQLVLGYWDRELIQSADLILISPGIDPNTPEIAESIGENTEVIGDVELFCRLVDAPIAAVTGSNGKSTVVSLLAHVGQALGKNTVLGGNVGAPILSQIQHNVDCYVLELSSFQLETIKSLRAKVATVLNVTDDHLDRHHTLENYAAIKRNIYQHCELAVSNANDHLTAASSDQNQVSFGLGHNDEMYALVQDGNDFNLVVDAKTVAALSELPLAGVHNGLNYLVVLALGNALGWPTDEMLMHLKSFKGLSHRCQLVESEDGITWINDSKATNVGAAVAAIKGVSPMVGENSRLVLIAGGDGKGADFLPLKSPLQQYVAELIVIGKDSSQIASLAKSAIRVDSIEHAVEAAREIVNPGDVVLLSPACASIDMFKSFVERGERFTKAVCGIKEKIS